MVEAESTPGRLEALCKLKKFNQLYYLVPQYYGNKITSQPKTTWNFRKQTLSEREHIIPLQN
jgi:hypothetical protein